MGAVYKFSKNSKESVTVSGDATIEDIFNIIGFGCFSLDKIPCDTSKLPKNMYSKECLAYKLYCTSICYNTGPLYFSSFSELESYVKSLLIWKEATLYKHYIGTKNLMYILARFDGKNIQDITVGILETTLEVDMPDWKPQYEDEVTKEGVDESL